MAILSPEMIKNLRAHRYSSEGHCIMEFPGVCKYIAEKLPRRLSPNAITLFGLLSSFTTCVLAAYHSCIGNEEGFRSMLYFCAFGFFLWLVCDNLDGIVARLRGCCGPFGEVLDHGGDAVAVVFAAVTIISCFNFQGSPLSTFVYVLSDVATNYISEPYTIYILGKFYIERIDFNEILLIWVAIALLTGSYGSGIWLYEIIPSTGFQVRYIFYSVKVCIVIILLHGKFIALCSSAHRSEKQRTARLLPLVPLMVVLISASIAYVSSSEEFLKQNVIQLALCFSFSIVKFHIELMVAHMVKSEVNAFNTSLILPISLALGIAISGEPSMEMRLTVFFLVSSAIVICHTFFLVTLYWTVSAFWNTPE